MFQLIVVDNASTDRSVEMIKNEFPKIEIVESNENTGFAKGNDLARAKTKGEIVLFLNPDTEIIGNVIEHCQAVLENDKDLGAIGCKVLLPDGQLDYSCHRGLPTVWSTFCYWTGLGRIFSKSPIFAGYSATYLDINTIHNIDCITGAFLMIRRKVLDQIGWWDTDYWWNGDDIEICYRIKRAGYKIRYDPTEKIIHFKGSSSGLQQTGMGNPTREIKIKAAKSAAKAMGIFVNKHQTELGSKPIITIVKLGIYLVEKFRLAKISLGFNYA